MDIEKTVTKLSDKVEKLTDDINKIKIIEEKQRNFESIISELKVEIGGIRSELPSLNTAIAELTNVLSNMTGKAEGAATARKTLWGMIGGLVFSGITGLTAIIFDLNSEVAVLKSEITTIKAVK